MKKGEKKVITLEDLLSVLETMNTISLSKPIRGPKDEGKMEFGNILPDPKSISPEEEFLLKEEREEGEKLLRSLPPREEKILRWRFGFEEFPFDAGNPNMYRGRYGELAEVSHYAIGRHLNLTHQRIMQMEKTALGKLRINLQGRVLN